MDEISFNVNSQAVEKATKESIAAALEAMGLQAVNYAKLNLEKDPRRVDTGNLRNSITHIAKKDEKAVYIGTNSSYAPYVEYGTGFYFDSNGNEVQGTPPKDQPIWWVYVKGEKTSGQSSGKRYTYKEAAKITAILRKKGLDAHMTAGMKANHFLKNAIANHTAEYKKITEQILAQNLNNT